MEWPQYAPTPSPTQFRSADPSDSLKTAHNRPGAVLFLSFFSERLLLELHIRVGSWHWLLDPLFPFIAYTILNSPLSSSPKTTPKKPILLPTQNELRSLCCTPISALSGFYTRTSFIATAGPAFRCWSTFCLAVSALSTNLR